MKAKLVCILSALFIT